jgi:capsid protein
LAPVLTSAGRDSPFDSFDSLTAAATYMATSLDGKSKRGGKREGAGRPKKGTNFSQTDGISSPQRMWIYTPSLDASKALTPSARLEQTKKSFFLYENIGLAARAVDGIAKFVGPLIPQAKTADEKWNRLAEQAFESACGNAPFGVDVAKQVNFYDAQELLVKQMALAGDVFWQKQTSNSGRALFRIIPGENVGSSHADVKDGWQDGVKVSKSGAAVRYRVLKSPGSYSEYNEISADDLTRVGKIDRVGQVRSRPWLHRAADNLQDSSEIVSYEKMSAKLGASLAFIITSPESGSIGLGSSLNKVATGGGGSITKDMITEGGSMIPQLLPGETITSLNNTHPANNLDAFLTYLRRDIAHGFNIPASVLFDPEAAGGATMRYAMVDAAKTISRIQEIIIQQFCAPFWKFWIFQEIEAGRLPFPNDEKDFLNSIDWVAPMNVSVDIGRDGRLYSDMLQRGQISPQDFFNMQGKDHDKVLDDTIRAAVRRKKRVAEIAAEEGVEISVNEVFPPAPGSPVPIIMPEQQDAPSV